MRYVEVTAFLSFLSFFKFVMKFKEVVCKSFNETFCKPSTLESSNFIT